MFKRKRQTTVDDGTGAVDGGEGRGVPLGGHDERPPTGYQHIDDEDLEISDRDFGWDEGDPADRRKDPLRR